MTMLVSLYLTVANLLDAYSVQIIASMQASFCGGCAYLIAFKYRRGNSSYHWMPSLCAFGLASMMAMQWLSITGRVLVNGDWPVVSLQNTFVFAILFVLLTRAKGNVARMFDFSDSDHNSDRSNA